MARLLEALLAEPSRVAVSPICTVISGPAFALGGTFGVVARILAVNPEKGVFYRLKDLKWVRFLNESKDH